MQSPKATVKIALFLSAIAISAPLPALAGWVPMGVTTDRTRVSVNSDAVVHQGQYAAYIIGESFAYPHEHGAMSSLTQLVMDCKTGRSETRRIIDYDATQNVVNDYRYEDGESVGMEPTSGSPSAAIQKYVCSR